MAPLEGPVSIGALVDAVMLGCVIVQSCVYYKNSSASAWFLNILVSLILFLLLSHLCLTTAWLWANEQSGSEGTSIADYGTILFGISHVFSAVIMFFERCFFTHHITKLSNNHILGFVFLVCCVFSFMAALGAASIFFTDGTADLTSQLSGSWVFPLAITSGLACDLVISTTTIFGLGSQTPTEIADFLGRVARLFLLVAETGFVASLFDIVIVLVYWLTKSDFAWVGLLVCMPGVFANTFLVALNAGGRLGADVEHRRMFGDGDDLIDGNPKKAPIIVRISKQVEKCSENCLV